MPWAPPVTIAERPLKSSWFKPPPPGHARATRAREAGE
jgi:hypothetical protein